VIGTRTALAALVSVAAMTPAHAAVVISTAATQNMRCSGGVCAPTATKAVLNVTDLENDLSQLGNVTVMTTGNGIEANNIVVRAAFSSPDSTSLTLDAHKTITITAAVSIGSGTAELELQSDTLDATDALSFGRKGHITFGNLSDIFGINGGIFTLVGSVQGLASAVAANPSGSYALANSYDASQDGTYGSSPIPTPFSGVFDGLENTVSNLSIIPDEKRAFAGFFEEVKTQGVVQHFGLSNIAYEFGNPLRSEGGLVDSNNGELSGDFVSGTFLLHLIGRDALVGGLVGYNAGTITHDSAQVSMSAFQSGGHNLYGSIGGLAGANLGKITASNATGDVTGLHAGGLVGWNSGSINASYATGSVQGQRNNNYATVVGGFAYDNSGGTIQNSYALGAILASSGYVGGFIGGNQGKIKGSYSTGHVTGSSVGGFDGSWQAPDKFSYCYWDTATSGTDNGTANGNLAGITGLTTTQLQSGLPTGFDPNIWAESPNINNGLPYLINNPPPN
jgi:hypothetical protein